MTDDKVEKPIKASERQKGPSVSTLGGASAGSQNKSLNFLAAPTPIRLPSATNLVLEPDPSPPFLSRPADDKSVAREEPGRRFG